MNARPLCRVTNRETRVGWPQLADGTEENGDSKTTNEKGPSWFVWWACAAGKRDFCSALAALVHNDALKGLSHEIDFDNIAKN
jgi:hypothetical protein